MNETTFRMMIREVNVVRDAVGGNWGGELSTRFYALGKLVRAHHKLCVRYCNEADFDQKKLDVCEKKIQTIINDMTGFFKHHNLRVEFQHDPRGLTVRVKVGEGMHEETLCALMEWK